MYKGGSHLYRIGVLAPAILFCSCRPIDSPTALVRQPEASQVVATTSEACSPQRSSKSDWNTSQLSAAAKSSLEDIGAKKGLSLDVLLGRLNDEFFGRQYSFEEFEASLSSLMHLISTIDYRAEAMSVDDSEPRMDAVHWRQPVVLYLDPTCDSCTRVLEVVMKARSTCPSVVPPVVLRPLPSRDPESIKAAAILLYLRESRKDDFVPAFIEFTRLLPPHHASVDDLAAFYMISAEYMESEAFSRFIAAAEHARNAYPGDSLSAPITLYRGRNITRSRAGEGSIPFDPFHNHQTLIEVFRLIDVAEEGD